MNPTNLLDRAVSLPRQDTFIGTWQAVLWQPDLFTPQSFVVGSFVRARTGETAFRLMDSPGRIECFFRPRPLKRDFAAIMAIIRAAMAKAGDSTELTLPSPNFSLTTPRFARGDSAQAVADSVFNDAVTAATLLPDEADSLPIGPDTEETRREVTRLLKQFAGLDYERIVREQGETLSEHYLDVSLVPDRGVGSIISTCFKSLNVIELKILRAAQDINAYATVRHHPAKAIFLLEPDDNAPIAPKVRLEMDNLIGSECWKLERAGFITPRNATFDGMARDIREWASPLLS